MNSIDVGVSWRILKSGRGKLWSFPLALSPYMRTHYGGPAIYRWIVTPPGQDEPQLIYIGEAVNLSRRVGNVLRPRRGSAKPKTSARLNAIFTEEVSRGNTVTVARAEFQDFSFNGVTFSQQDMSLFHKFKRCALESLFLCSYLGLGKRLLNLRMEPSEYFKKKWIAIGLKSDIAEEMMKAMPEEG
jgi:hypothetical protein